MKSLATQLLSILESSIPDWVIDELIRYNDKAGRIPNKLILPYLEPFVPSSPITIYRGLGLTKAEASSFLKKTKLSPTQGAKGIYKTGKFQSWTLSQSQAKEFAGKYSIIGRDPDSLGVVIKANIQPKDIALPIHYLPQDIKRKLNFDQQELVLHPGKYNIQIVELDGDWSAGKIDFNKLIMKAWKELEKKINAKKTKNWDKSPGFTLDLLDYPLENKWRPSIYVGISDSLRIRIEPFFKLKSGLETKNLDFKSLQEMADFIDKDLVDYVEKFYHQAKIKVPPK